MISLWMQSICIKLFRDFPELMKKIKQLTEIHKFNWNLKPTLILIDTKPTLQLFQSNGLLAYIWILFISSLHENNFLHLNFLFFVFNKNVRVTSNIRLWFDYSKFGIYVTPTGWSSGDKLHFHLIIVFGEDVKI